MDLMNYVISIALIAITIQFGEVWMGLGATLIIIVASKEFKASILMILTFISMYVVNGMGMSEYWLFAAAGLIALGYLIGMGAEPEQAADPYAGLLGGMGM
jgi:hypothetical protein